MSTPTPPAPRATPGPIAGYTLASHDTVTLGDLLHVKALQDSIGRRQIPDPEALVWLFTRWLHPTPTRADLLALSVPLVTALATQVLHAVTAATQRVVLAQARETSEQ